MLAKAEGGPNCKRGAIWVMEESLLTGKIVLPL
jgi:hypothetical protein